ncbi:MAG: hypothetical protein FJW23_02580 [Acidimicrobiia bacterium]|nr:hypothetical protein [Acidimicrobiia bacterium]
MRPASGPPSAIARTAKAIADPGARFIGSSVLFLEGAARDHFFGFLQAEYPDLVERYGRLYAGKCAGTGCRREVSRAAGLLRAKHGLPAGAAPARSREVLPVMAR